MKTPVLLYGMVPYDRGAKARWLLTEMEVPYETKWLDREKGENEQPEYLRINPSGRVPSAKIGDQTIFESGAICMHLADLHADRGMAPALGTPERAHYLKWMYFAESTIAALHVRIMIVEDIPAGEVRMQKESALLEDLRDTLTALDQGIASNQFLINNNFSAADICVSYHLHWLKYWQELEAVMREFPRVMNYLARMEQMPSAKKADVFSYQE